MHAEHETLIHRLYAALDARDAEAMVACYGPEAAFTDPVFGTLDARETAGMWRMLCARATDLRVEVAGIEADDAAGRARWEAWYAFGATGRPVHNRIAAAFVFKDGLIHRHEDAFDLWRWAGMALGPAGRLLGWTPAMQARIRQQARRGLDRFLQQAAAG